MIYFVLSDHFRDKIVEYCILGLGTVYLEEELVEITVDIKAAYPLICGTYARLYLVRNSAAGLKLSPLLLTW